VQVCALRVADENVRRVADKVYEDLKKAGVEVIYDDRNISAGVMFSDADLLGVPLRIVISPKTLERNVLEFAARDKSFKEDLSPDNFVDEVKAKINAMIAALTPED